MKRMFWMLAAALVAATMLLAAPCAAENEGVITQSACSIVRSGEAYHVYCFAQIRNDSDQIICLDEGELELHNGDQLLASQRVTQLWPYFLEPGQEGYLVDVVVFEPNEDGVVLPSVTGLTYDLAYMDIDPLFAGQALYTGARLERSGHGSKATLICEVTNPTQEEIYHPTIAFGLYSDVGQLLYADGTTLYDVGIPAGGKVLVRFDVDEEFVTQWNSYGIDAAQAHVYAMYRSETD